MRRASGAIKSKRDGAMRLFCRERIMATFNETYERLITECSKSEALVTEGMISDLFSGFKDVGGVLSDLKDLLRDLTYVGAKFFSEFKKLLIGISKLLTFDNLHIIKAVVAELFSIREEVMSMEINEEWRDSMDIIHQRKAMYARVLWYLGIAFAILTITFKCISSNETELSVMPKQEFINILNAFNTENEGSVLVKHEFYNLSPKHLDEIYTSVKTAIESINYKLSGLRLNNKHDAQRAELNKSKDKLEQMKTQIERFR
jgi:hypothetical protein